MKTVYEFYSVEVKCGNSKQVYKIVAENSSQATDTALRFSHGEGWQNDSCLNVHQVRLFSLKKL